MPSFLVLDAARNAHQGTVVAYYPSMTDNVYDERFLQSVVREFRRLIPSQEQNEDPFARFSVKCCIRSLVQHATGPFFISSKPYSVSCEETLQYRFNPLEGAFGVQAECEVKTLILSWSKKKEREGSNVRMYVLPSNAELAKKETRDASMFQIEEIGLSAGIITPTTFLAHLSNNFVNSRGSVHLRLTDQDRRRLLAQEFLTDNLGVQTLSCTVPSGDFLAGIDTAYKRYRDLVRADAEREQPLSSEGLWPPAGLRESHPRPFPASCNPPLPDDGFSSPAPSCCPSDPSLPGTWEPLPAAYPLPDPESPPPAVTLSPLPVHPQSPLPDDTLSPLPDDTLSPLPARCRHGPLRADAAAAPRRFPAADLTGEQVAALLRGGGGGGGGGSGGLLCHAAGGGLGGGVGRRSVSMSSIEHFRNFFRGPARRLGRN